MHSSSLVLGNIYCKSVNIDDELKNISQPVYYCLQIQQPMYTIHVGNKRLTKQSRSIHNSGRNAHCFANLFILPLPSDGSAQTFKREGLHNDYCLMGKCNTIEFIVMGVCWKLNIILQFNIFQKTTYNRFHICKCTFYCYIQTLCFMYIDNNV